MLIGLIWKEPDGCQSYYLVLYFHQMYMLQLQSQKLGWILSGQGSGAPPSALPHTDAVDPEQGQRDAGVHAGSQVGPGTVAVRTGDKVFIDILPLLINFIVNVIQKQSLGAIQFCIKRSLSGCWRYDDDFLYLYSILCQCHDVDRISNWRWSKWWENI